MPSWHPAAVLQRHWWRPAPTPLTAALRPLAALYAALHRRQRARTAVEPLAVPVVVVGNVVVGGAGKTPVVMALVQALRARGWTPGVVSRGYGRRNAGGPPCEVRPDSLAADTGDEPLLIRRRTGAPVWVGARRVQAARALLAAHPEVNLLVSDDGLQHTALPRQAEVLVFDERGLGNGLLLPAGPLREPCPAALPPQRLVLYTAGSPSTPLPGWNAQRHLHTALPLAAWWSGQTAHALPLPALAARLAADPVPPLAVAGIAAPQKFFGMLQAAGLRATPSPQPDHARYDTPPWPDGFTGAVLTTEKDAVKLPPQGATGVSVWVLPLDLSLPDGFLDALASRLPPPPALAPAARTARP
jgi:tetraacyldisaccharide 4'-kinase